VAIDASFWMMRKVGKDLQRIDGFDKVTGRAKYGIDQRLPGMLYATVLRPLCKGNQWCQSMTLQPKR
jgi:hypothetical protein